MSGHRPGSEWEDVFGIVLVLALGAVAAVLLTGHLSALIVDRAVPEYRVVDIPEILRGVAAAPGDPGRAWDSVNRGGRPPGPLAFYGTAAALVMGALVLWLAATRTPSPARSDGDGIDWANWRQRRRLRVARTGSRLVVGRSTGLGRGLVAVEERHSLLVFGSTQSGKTTGLAVPAILEWPGPVLCTSTKGDLVDDTAGWRSTKGRVQVFDPADVTDHPGSSWSPMAASTTWEGAMADASALAAAGKAAVGEGVKMAAFWYSGAEKLLAPYLFAAARSGGTITDVARWVDAAEFEAVADLIGDSPDALTAHRSTFLRAEEARSSLFQVCQQMLAVYLDPVVARSAGSSEIVASDLFADGAASTLYVTAPLADQDRFQTVFSTIVRQVIDAAYARVAATGRPLDPPLLVVLDECANIAPVHGLDQVVSTAASHGIQLVTVFQDLAQLERRFDRSAKTIVNNHRGMVLLPGCKDVDTLNLASQLIGDHSIDRPSVTRQHGGQRSSTTGAEWRPLMSPALARTLDDGRGVLIYGNVPPIKIRLRPWFKNRRLRAKATTKRPSAPPKPQEPPPQPPDGQGLREDPPAVESTPDPPRLFNPEGLRPRSIPPGPMIGEALDLPDEDYDEDADDPTPATVIDFAHHQARTRRETAGPQR
ncbi:MAG: type IV secretory system conjugative DNA transfer family protein [Acidimicrobiales bacterium]|nr:type IV secretory system conjugative DNA transfer family protein [Acidimicrobiales bacterium]